MNAKAQKIAEAITNMDGFRARAWTKIQGKERVYVEFVPKLNGGRNWHGGIGWGGYYDCNAHTWNNWSWAGAATRKAYEERIEDMQDAIATLAE